MDLGFLFQLVCLVIFAAAGFAWILNVYRQIELDPDQTKLLNAAFGVSVVGGLASLVGPGFFDNAGNDEPPTDIPTSNASGSTGLGNDDGELDPFEPLVVASRSPTDIEPDHTVKPRDGTAAQYRGDNEDETKGVRNLDPKIQAFLKDNNLVRPMVDPLWEQSYPGCAVNARTSELAKTSARDCMKELDKFNSEFLIPYQRAYEQYVPKVSEISYSQPAGPILDFVREEARSFSQGTNEVAQNYRAASGELDADYATLRSQAY